LVLFNDGISAFSMNHDPKDKPAENTNKNTKEDTSPRVFLPPLPNYTLSRVCPACGAPSIRRACKVRCERCGFVWDCSEV
jgi:predicted RNA-binding Zn-ribbon protein involved in translation (DUF1610 family)